jgi:hypothetical protein
MCYCAVAARWWRPAANPAHSDVYCPRRAAGHRVLALPEQGPRLVYSDGLEYQGLPAFDGSAFVPMRVATPRR